jgi:hypothetical protein
VAILTLAGVLLASCAATAKKATPHVTGLPAISISVPLSSVACTTNDSCVTLGTSNLEVSPTSVAEYRSAKGRWTALPLPVADASTYIASSSCWSDGCLFVGSQSSGDLVWRYDTSTHAIIATTPPKGGSGIAAISCFASLSCAVLDATTSGPRFLTTSDGGTTWSAPATLGVPARDFVSALSCPSSLKCIASFRSPSTGIAVYVTDDGGTTWTQQPGHSTVTWSVLTSLHCDGRKCLGLAKLSFGWRVERTNNFGVKWSKVASPRGSNLTMACTSLEHCVIGGMTNFQSSSPWLETLDSRSVTAVKLTYVPSPISDVACGVKVCAAVGVTTVMTLSP